MRGSRMSARAIAIRWRWPPESVIPRSPIVVSYPSGSSSMKSCACASRAARTTSSSVAAGAPKVMFSRTVAEKRNGSCATIPIARRSDGELDLADVGAVDGHPALRDVVEARHERGERRLARAGLADERDRPPGLDLEVDLLEDRPARGVREGGALEARSDPRRAEARGRRGASVTSSVSSITSKIRSPDAVARCACPIHMPSIRSGMTSISTSTLKAKNELSASSPLATIRPP